MRCFMVAVVMRNGHKLSSIQVAALGYMIAAAQHSLENVRPDAAPQLVEALKRAVKEIDKIIERGEKE